MAHGLTVTTLLLRKKTTPRAEIRMKKAPPTDPAKISIRWFSFLEPFGVKAGEGDEIECVGSGIATDGFAARGGSVIGFDKGKGEEVKKPPEGDSDGDDIGDTNGDGDGEGEFDNGDGESGESGESEGDTEAEKGLRNFGIPSLCLPLTCLALAGFRNFGNCSSLL